MKEKEISFDKDYTVDFVIITALAEEQDAVIQKLPGCRQLPPDTEDIHIYYQADLPVTFSDHTSGFYRIIVMSLLGIGRVQAAAATTDAIRRWHPRYILLVGIAGGIAVRNIGIGDILLSDQIVDYEIQKLTSKGPQIRWEVQRADPRLLGAGNSVRDESWQGFIDAPRPDPGQPKFHTGPIASGDKVIAFGKILAKYQKIWPKLIGVEMEAAGVATAAFQSVDRPGFFMVRGVSDLADENKNTTDVEKWRPYACNAAAAFTISLLKKGPVPLSIRPVHQITKKVQLFIEGDLADFTVERQQELIGVLSAILHMDPRDIRLLKIQSGSILLMVEMPEKMANRLYELVTRRDIRIINLGIKSIWIEGKKKLDPTAEITGTRDKKPEYLSDTMDAMHDLSLATLASQCNEQNALLFSRREFDPRFCFEVFRRAIQEKDDGAWGVIYKAYKDLIAGWVRRHPGFNATGEDEQYFINATLLKLWQSLTPERFSSFSDLKNLLRYMQICVHSVIIDAMRTKYVNEQLEDFDQAEDVEADAMVQDQAEFLWNLVKSRLQDSKETQVAYAAFVLGLKPAEILEQNPGRYHSLQEIYQIKESITRRLLRDQELRNRLGILEGSSHLGG